MPGSAHLTWKELPRRFVIGAENRFPLTLGSVLSVDGDSKALLFQLPRHHPNLHQLLDPS